MYGLIAVVLIASFLTLTAGAAEVAPAPLWPEKPACLIPQVEKASLLDTEDPLSDPVWDKVEPIGPFYARGEMLPSDFRTVVKAVSSGGVLYVAATCSTEARPDGSVAAGTAPGDSIAFYFTQGAEPAFPYVEIRVDRDGTCTVSRYFRSHPWWKGSYPVESLDSSLIKLKTGSSKYSWWVCAAIPRADYGIPEGSFHANFVRQLNESSRFAWADLRGALPHNPYHFGVMSYAGASADPLPGVRLPATLAVGVNRLKLVNWREGCRLLVDGRAVAVDGESEATFETRDRGAAVVRITDASGKDASACRANIRRPLTVEAVDPFPVLDRPLAVRLDLIIAAGAEAEVTLEATQREVIVASAQARLAAGSHMLELDTVGAEPGEISLVARARLESESGKPIDLRARHWCFAGGRREDFDRFRDGLDGVPISSLYRAGLADACAFYRLLQAGDGRYRTMRDDGRFGFTEWNYCGVYAFALLYKTAWPENPYAGDERFLASAVAGMEAGLDPDGVYNVGGYSRHIQAYVLTYELLKNDIEPERERYWRTRLNELIEHILDSHVEPARHVNARYSLDVGTGTNHYAYYVANVYAAGRALSRPDWLELARDSMILVSKHEQDGQFAERRGVPATHYTWLTMNALGEYWTQSGDNSVRANLERCAEFSCHTSLPDNDIMLLHDGRNNTYHPYLFGDFVLSLTPHGRYLARRRAQACISSSLCPGSHGPEYWFRAAENALYFEDGPEEPLPADAQYHFLDGRALVARSKGFIYGLSAIPLPPTTEEFWLDPQNTIEIHHESAGPILHGANSHRQPEGGSFMRRAGDREVFMPVEGEIEDTYDGHMARVVFDTFTARLTCRVLSEKSIEVKVELLSADGDEPVIYSFFPAAAADEPVVEDAGRLLRFGKFDIRCNRPVEVERDFRITNPYTLKRDVEIKPVRAYAALEPLHPLVIEIQLTQP